jgi:hypothetical protein
MQGKVPQIGGVSKGKGHPRWSQVFQRFLKGSGNPSESAIVDFDLQPPQVHVRRDNVGDSTSAGIVVP